MASEIKVDNIKPSGGTTITIPDGSTIAGNLTFSGSTSLNSGFNRVLQVQSVFYTTTASTATVYDYDDNVPAITEGAEFATLAITPISATSTLVFHVFGNGTSSFVGTNTFMITLHNKTTSSGALLSIGGPHIGQHVNSNGSGIYTEASATTNLRTYSLRFGTTSGTAYINSDGGASQRRYGGSKPSGMVVYEVET